MTTANVLPPAVHSQLGSLTTITDATWQFLSRLRDLLHPDEVKHYCWTLTLLDNLGRFLDIPGGFDPLEHHDAAPPVQALRAALNVLAGEGWQAVSVDTEHDDDDPPNADWLDPLSWESLRAVRYGLVRINQTQASYMEPGRSSPCKS